MYRVNGPLHTWLSSTNIKPNKASPPSLHTAAAAGRRHRSLLILSVDSLWKPVVRAAERLPASCDCVSPEHSSSLYSDTADSFSPLASSRFDNGGNCSCLHRSDRKWILTLQADDQVCRSVCVCSCKALIMCVFITFTCLHMISVELCRESSRTVLMNSLCPPLRACFVLLHSLKRSRRRAMSSLRLLALRWSMTTPYWCTLAPFRSLPAAVNPAADDQSVRHAFPPSPRATCLPQPRPQPRAPAGRPGMFQRFASALFGDDVEELSRNNRPGDGKEEEEDEDWILVNYLGESFTSKNTLSAEGKLVVLLKQQKRHLNHWCSCRLDLKCEKTTK